MNRARFLLVLLALSTSALSTPLLAAPITSAKVTTAAASGPLLRQIEAIPDRTWAGYALPAAPRRGFFCDWGMSTGGHDELQPLAVFFRVEDHRIERLRLLSANCSLDADRPALDRARRRRREPGPHPRNHRGGRWDGVEAGGDGLGHARRGRRSAH